jgi:hypothetical protein
MAKRRPIPPKKRRTREHVLADLSVNHVERQALLCGFSVLRVSPDYGYDVFVFTFDTNGEVEPGELRLQLKATERLAVSRRREMFPFALEVADLRLWQDEVLPVILVLYEAETNRAYWECIQTYLQEQVTYEVDWTQKTLTVQVPKRNVLDQTAFAALADVKRRILEENRKRRFPS